MEVANAQKEGLYDSHPYFYIHDIGELHILCAIKKKKVDIYTSLLLSACVKKNIQQTPRFVAPFKGGIQGESTRSVCMCVCMWCFRINFKPDWHIYCINNFKSTFSISLHAHLYLSK